MSYMNLTRKIHVFIGDENVSEYLIEGSLSDDSAYTNNIITTKGTITLGTTNQVLDVNKTRFEIGEQIKIWVELSDGKLALHPRGTLYVINSSINIDSQTINLEVGCSLAFIADKENQYGDAVASLFEDFGKIHGESEDLFVIEEKDLSSLSKLLEVQGYAIYQDQYGNVQKIKSFGNDTFGSNLNKGKVTSFDKYTAISIESISDSAFENDVQSVKVNASIDIPTAGEDDNEDEDNFPQPFISSVTKRTIDTPWLTPAIWSGTQGSVWITNESTQEITSENNPNCGTFTEPTATPSGTGFSFTVRGEAAVFNRQVSETVTSGKYTRYRKKDNQLSIEESWEYSSASTWAQSAVSATLGGLAGKINEIISEANALASKANQHFDAVEDEPLYVVPAGSTQSVPNPKRIFHICNANTFYAAMQQKATVAGNLMNSSTVLGQNLQSIYNLASLQQTFYSYNDDGSVRSKITKNWQQPASFDGEYSHDVTVYEDAVLGTNYTIVARPILVARSRPNGRVVVPKSYNLRLANQSTVRYSYYSLYTVESEEYEDFQNPKNSYSKRSYSSSTSKNALQPDRIIDNETESINGTTYCQRDTEKKDFSIEIETKQTTTASSRSWFGNGEAYTKEVQFPLEFAPLLPIYDESTETCTEIDVASRVDKYEQILKNYARILAKKIAGDNRGFRVNESLRSEFFEYYPYFPISISLETIGKAFATRAASSNWVFNSESAVCSFDCFVTGALDVKNFVNPFINAVYLKTESPVNLTTSILNTQNTANTIKIKSLPAGGSLTVSGSPVAVDDVIDITDIESNNFTFTPSGGGTTEIAFKFESYDSSDQVLNGIDNVFPPLSISGFLTADNYYADGGEFTLDESNGGLNCDGGNFDTGASVNFTYDLDSGNFDTGATVVLPAPSGPVGAPSSNDSIDPETDLGIYLRDSDDTQLLSSSLPATVGELNSVLDIVVNFNALLNISAKLATTIIDNLGWDYGNYTVALGTDIDLGSFGDPNEYDLDFGSLTTELDPKLESSVV